MDIALNLINQSDDQNNSNIVIFQKNRAASDGASPIAWKVIQNCAVGTPCPFTLPEAMTVGASDTWGNFTPPLSAQNGQLFQMTTIQSGDTMSYLSPGSNRTTIQLVNNLPTSSISAYIYKDGCLLAAETSISPAQMVNFQFEPTVWIGAVSQANEGEPLNSAMLSNVNTELSLQGVASADIVMTGGGPGASSTPYAFTLQNVVMG